MVLPLLVDDMIENQKPLVSKSNQFFFKWVMRWFCHRLSSMVANQKTIGIKSIKMVCEMILPLLLVEFNG